MSALAAAVPEITVFDLFNLKQLLYMSNGSVHPASKKAFALLESKCTKWSCHFTVINKGK
ncbi:hypothetical protein GCM10010918_02830 [Paenibacillus radicis (ex Gao et al. 2016)]|uniref:Uncharacterized protein n=1 Tax=Paenibacillus radicis (ex Gao et al. 2016) TaxID=1737354 RepID=A0A917GPM0_9BACL|nr:hypothetical protein GCM10010918_02830 [Paenibacillus radicis (ex Gao et al. 2016)]